MDAVENDEAKLLVYEFLDFLFQISKSVYTFNKSINGHY